MIFDRFGPAIAAALAVACSGLHTTGASAQHRPSAPWELVLRMSGGIAGLDQQVTVKSTGELTAADFRRKVKGSREVPASVIADLDKRIAQISSGGSGRSRQCRDCLVYHLEVRRPADPIAVEVDDLTMSGTPLEPLVRQLTTMLVEALPK